jgi:NAD(P)H-flavin reductase
VPLASHPRDVVFRAELDHIAARGVTVHYLLGSRHQLGTDPLSASRLKGLVPGLHRQEAYICGPPGMTEAAVTALRTASGRQAELAAWILACGTGRTW